MADYTQSNTAVLAQQQMTHPASVIGSAVDVSTMLQGVVYIWKAVVETTADLVAGLDYIALQTSPDATGNNWYDYFKTIPSGTAAVSEALNNAGGESAGQAVCRVASTADFTIGTSVFITDAGGTNAVEGEWHTIQALSSNASYTMYDNLAYAKAQNDVIYNQAERWAVGIDFAGVQRIRVVVIHQGATGSDWVVKAVLEAATDIE